MSESSWLTSAAVNGNTDVNDVLDVAEQLVKIGIGHLESEVADEEGLGWGVLLAGLLGVGHVVDDHAAAGEEGVVEVLDGLGGGLDVLELDISESIFVLVLCLGRKLERSGKSIPLGKTTWVLCDSSAHNLAESTELLLELLWGGLEKKVADIEGLVWLSLISWWGRERSLSWRWSIVPCGDLLLDSLLSLGSDVLGLLSDLLGLLLDVLNGGLNLLGKGLVGVVATECGDDGSLLADGEWSGWSRGADSGGGWGGDGAERGSLDEVPTRIVS